MAERTPGGTNHSKPKKVWNYVWMRMCLLAVSLVYAMSSQNTNTHVECV